MGVHYVRVSEIRCPFLIGGPPKRITVYWGS